LSVQTMWKKALTAAPLEDVVHGLEELQAAGCDLVRFAVPDLQSAELLGELAGMSPLVLAADIHFDYRLALRCLDFPIPKIRINPGNIGDEWKVREVVAKAHDAGASLRIGVNAGSLPRALRDDTDQARAMVYAAESEMELLEKLDFHSVVF
jgi:(E)-4-hydroxy-3-methylbut-2-enyl-diphosphate synthase